MKAQSRRDALLLGAGMGAAALLGQAMRPVATADGAAVHVDLDRLVPERFGAWRVDDAMRAFVSAADRQGKRYGLYDQVLERTFVDAEGRRVMLSVAFGGEQSANLQLHRPEICYRANGYAVRGMHGDVLTLADQPVPVTRLEADLPGRHEPITYWTVLGGVVVADEEGFRWRRLSFALRRRLLDGMLVRVSSIDADAPGAYRHQAAFADALMRALAPPDRALLIGRTTA